MSIEEQSNLRLGPDPNIIYPIQVQYCGNCSLPIEYCEYYPEYEKCKQWLERNLPTEFEKVKLVEDNSTEVGGGEDEKKRQKRGGKGMLKTKKKEDVPKLVTVSRAPRGKKKSVTVVTGLSTFDIDLKVAAKFFGSKFACGSSVTGDDEIVIQGDVKDELFEVIPEKWPQIDEDSIDDLGDQNAGPALDQLLEILILVVSAPSSAFKAFVPSVTNLCLGQVWPAVGNDLSAHPDTTLVLLKLFHSILMHRWQYFYNTSILRTLGHTDEEESVEHKEELVAILEAFGQALLQPDVNIFRQSLQSLEQLNVRWRLYQRAIFKVHLLGDELT